MKIFIRDDKGNIIHRGDVLINVNKKPYVYYYFFNRKCVIPLCWQSTKKEVYTLAELKDGGYIKIAMNKYLKNLAKWSVEKEIV